MQKQSIEPVLPPLDLSSQNVDRGGFDEERDLESLVWPVVPTISPPPAEWQGRGGERRSTHYFKPREVVLQCPGSLSTLWPGAAGGGRGGADFSLINPEDERGLTNYFGNSYQELHVLDTVIYALQVLTHIILPITLHGKCCILKPDAFPHQQAVNIFPQQIFFPMSINIHTDLMAAVFLCKAAKHHG